MRLWYIKRKGLHPSKHLKSDHHRPASETDGGQHCILAGTGRSARLGEHKTYMQLWNNLKISIIYRIMIDWEGIEHKVGLLWKHKQMI